MMLRVFLGACLLVAALADEHVGCCSHEDRREIQYLWDSVWSASFTERKVMIAKAVFDESVAQLSFSSSSSSLLVHGQVTIIFVVSVCPFVCLFVCAEFLSAVFDPMCSNKIS